MLDFESLTGQSIALLGQSKNFAFEEIEELLQLDKIRLEKSIKANCKVVIAGRLLNPHLEAEIDLLEKDPNYTVVSIESFEKDLARSIHQEGLYLSLKLSHNNERIQSYICNALISDAIILTLLPLFDWAEETLFGNDANRDICAALTRRFYPKVIQNHNIEYSPNGIHETVLETDNEALLFTLAQLAPIQMGFGADDKAIEHQILEAIAANPAVNSQTLKLLAKKDDGRLSPLIAVSKNLDAQTATILFETRDPQVLVGLGCNSNVDQSIRLSLLKDADDVSRYLAEHAPMMPEMFEAITLLLPALSVIGKNGTLTAAMVQYLLAYDDAGVRASIASNPLVAVSDLEEFCHSSDPVLLEALALNPKLSSECFERLSALHKADIDQALAQNTATPKMILDTLAHHQSEAIVKNVASNPGTSVETLYQLLLDFRYATLVKANPSFGENIRQEIGWES